MDTKKLRQKILDLAIRGKLVPQDPNDEPASVLLERIKTEKERLIKKGKIKRNKKETTSDTSHYRNVPFEVPEGWVWTRLGEIAFYKKGPFGSSITKSMFIPKSDGAIKVYEQKNAIYKDASLGSYYISSDKFEQLKGFGVFPNDIIVSCAGTIGETFVMPDEMETGIINQALMKIKLYDDRIVDFYLLYFDFILKNQAKEEGKGTAMKNIPPLDVLKEFLIPLPPIEEQKRITNFLKYINIFIQNIENDEDALVKLTKIAKSKVLDLAIHGKLVPQDSADEPASVLLERIKKEKKSAKISSDISHYPFEVPEGWSWASGHECLNPMKSKKPVGETFRYIDINSIDNEKHIIRDAKLLKLSDAPSRASRDIAVGDTLFSMVRPYLENIALVEDNYQDGIASTGFFVCKPNKTLYPKYLFYLMLSSYVIVGLNSFMKGDNSPSINNENITSFLYPIPPLSEQKRIVIRIEILFQTLDTISNNL